MDLKISHNAFIDIALGIDTNNCVPLNLLLKVGKFRPQLIEDVYFNEIKQCVEYLNNHFYSSFPQTIQVLVNTPTLLNRALRIALTGFGIFNKSVNNYNRQYKRFINPEQCFASLENYQIVIGTPILEKKDSEFIKRLSFSNDKKTISQLVFFHEVGHFLENKFSNKRNENWINNDFTQAFINLKDSQYNTNLNTSLANDLINYQKEIYADVCSVLLKRNYDIEKLKAHSNTDEKIDENTILKEVNHIFTNSINNLIEARIVEQEQCIHQIIEYEIEQTLEFQFLNSSFLLKSVEHMTSPALEILHSIECIHESLTLCEEDINKIANYCVEETMKKVFYILGKGDDKIKNQLNLLFEHHDNYIEIELKNLLPEQWLEKMNDIFIAGNSERKIKSAFDTGLKKINKSNNTKAISSKNK